MHEEELSAMTTNERLLACGLLDAWDRAVTDKNREEAIRVLLEAALKREAAEAIVDKVFSNPDKYKKYQ